MHLLSTVPGLMNGVIVSTICVGLNHLQIQVINSDNIILNLFGTIHSTAAR